MVIGKNNNNNNKRKNDGNCEKEGEIRRET